MTDGELNGVKKSIGYDGTAVLSNRFERVINVLKIISTFRNYIGRRSFFNLYTFQDDF